MGMEYTVRFPGGTVPALSQIIQLLAEHNFPVQVRMVDGELTLPGEVPPERWREVRLGTPAGMITLARRGTDLAVVTWGNAEAALQRAWNAVAWAVAKAGDGDIARAGGPERPDAFRASVSMPEALRA